MYERFTDRARKIMQLANQEAVRFNHEYIGTEHILLGLIKEGSGVAANVLKNLDIDLAKIRGEVEKIVQSGPDVVTMGKLPQTPRAKEVIKFAIEEARNLNHNYVGTEHLMLGLLREQEGVAAQVLMNLGLRLDDVRQEVLNLLGHNPEADVWAGQRPVHQGTATVRTPTLDSFAADLTALARKQSLVPCVGRSNEIDQTLLVLACRNEGNPLLVGPVGVGKSSIIRGLAQLVIGDTPPEYLRGRRIVHLRLRSVVIHAKDDSRKLLRCAQTLASEVRGAGNVVLFVDDLFAYGHDSRLFKSALDANDVQCIASVTPEVYHGTIARDAVLSRNFQPVFVGPPPTGEVVAILGVYRAYFEKYHQVQIADEAVAAAAELSERRLMEGCQPTKALRLLDQAAALFRLHHAPAPPDTREFDRLLEELNVAKENAVAQADFEKAAGYRDEADKLKKKKQQLASRSAERVHLDGVVDRSPVEQVVTKLTGIQFPGSDAIREKPP